MARRYSVFGDQNAAAPATIVSLGSATTIRPRLYEWIFGSAATPADNAFNLQVSRITALGTSTAVTPVALDPSDPASLMTCGYNHTVEPTYTAGAVMQSVSINQQASWRWCVPPAEGITMPATASNGLGIKFVVVSGGTANSEVTAYVEE